MPSSELPGQKTLQKLSRLLVAPTVEPGQRAARIQTVEKDIVLPIKGLLIAILVYYFFFSEWIDAPGSLRQRAMDWIRAYFWFYTAAHVAITAIFIRARQFSLRTVEWIVFGAGLLDGILMAALTFTSTGFDSLLYWVFLVLILRNALAIPLATPQIALNLIVSACFICGGIADKTVFLTDATADELSSKIRPPAHQSTPNNHRRNSHPPGSNTNSPTAVVTVAPAATGSNMAAAITNSPLPENPPPPELIATARAAAMQKYAETHIENPVERLIVLVLWALCCYGIQMLFEKQKRAEAEATELAVRQERLHTAGRMAAEIAHQIKNPLGIISNAAFCLDRAAKQGQRAAPEQVEIIREEIERADRIITELMGYAQLAEGKVEKLDVAEELNRAAQEVLPSAAQYEVVVHREFAPELPALLMQRRHLNGVLVNILQNAREAMNGKGEINLTARYGTNDSIEIIIADNGPGIPPDKIDKIFEAYFTTRSKGTGLGLAIVKHNTEIYGGTVRVESELGKGTRFILQFPPRILMRMSQ